MIARKVVAHYSKTLIFFLGVGGGGFTSVQKSEGGPLRLSSSSQIEFYKRFFFKALLRLRRLVPLFLNWMADRMWQTVKKKVEEKILDKYF